MEEIHKTFIEEQKKENLNEKTKPITDFEDFLKCCMVRHERTRLQGKQEEHIRLYPAKDLCEQEYAEILRNTCRQSHLLKEAGYPEGAQKWGWNLPWVLSFSRKQKENSYFKVLRPTAKLSNTPDAEKLFAYDDGGNPKEILLDLPEQSLALGQICRENLKDSMMQLLWVPPTVPLYQPAGIYETYSGYSKLLVFAEYQYLQRGGAILLSDYAKLMNSKSQIPDNFPPELDCCKYLNNIFCLTNGDYREKTLDDLVEYIKNEYPDDMGDSNGDTKALALIASPAACAKYLGCNEEAFENIFNEYFKRDGVKHALWAWMCERNLTDPTQWESGLLRYCAEGNLYAVLEEYQFTCKGKLDKYLPQVLDSSKTKKKTENEKKQNHYTPSRVFVQTWATTQGGNTGKERICSFADRLTNDIHDNGTGSQSAQTDNGKEEVRMSVAAAFSSPFWPMVMFAGRGAQEGMDFHQYCLRIMHLTLPRGAVSFEQRQGRIDRYHSLLVRRRAAERLSGIGAKTTERMMERMFAHLVKENQDEQIKTNQIYPHWSIPNEETNWRFQRMMPFWEFTQESVAANIMHNMLASYRADFGIRPDAEVDLSVDLSASEVSKKENDT